jgi:hypothetical protein
MGIYDLVIFADVTAEPLIFALFAVWYQEKFGKI